MSADKAAANPPQEDTAPASNERIATYFAATYANMVNTEGGQEDLYRLYGPEAELTHVTPDGTMKAKTVKAIREQLSNKSSLAGNIAYTSITVQEGYKQCVIVLATGVQSPPESGPRAFSQVFVLVPQPEGFYCNNDVFIVQEPLSLVSAQEEPVANGDVVVTTDEEEKVVANGEVAVTEPTAVEEEEHEEVAEAEEEDAPAAVEESSAPAPAPAPAPAHVQEQAASAHTPEAVVVAEEPPVVAPAPAKVFSYASLAAQPKSTRPAPKAVAKPAAAPAPAAAKMEADTGAATEDKQATKPQRARTAPQSQNQVFIRNTKPGTKEQLSKIFGEYGTVEKVQLKDNYGFVTFSDSEAVAKAVADGEVSCDNERVNVEVMKTQKPGSAGRGRGRTVRGGRGGDSRRGGAKPKAA